jgi:hypothetical protein
MQQRNNAVAVDALLFHPFERVARVLTRIATATGRDDVAHNVPAAAAQRVEVLYV